MKPVFTPLAIPVIIIIISARICDARILNVPEDYQTIQAGIDSSMDGDTVLVQPGEYHESLVISSRRITLASTLLNDPDNRAIIDETIVNGDDSGCGVSIEGNPGEFILIGFTITNAGWRGDDNRELGGGMRITGQAVVRLRSLNLSGNRGRGGNGDGAAGIYAEGNIDIDAAELSIVDNTAEDQASGALHLGNGVSMQLMGGRISGNEAVNSIISCFDASALILSSVEFRDNLSSSGTSYVVFIGRPSRLLMEECVVTDNTGYRLIRTTDGIFRAIRTLFAQGQGTISVDPLYFVVVNGIEEPNRLDDCTISGFSEDYSAVIGGAPTSIRNSIVWGNGAGLDGNFTVSYSVIQGGWQGEGNLDSDPLFLDPDNGDYHLTANSPCIDAGDPEAPLNPDGTRADIGAFYFHQRDIAIAPAEIHFAPIPFGVLDSLPLTISNTGGNDLLFCIPPTLEASCIWMRQMENQDTLTLPAHQDTVLWVLFHPEEGAPMHRWIMIESNDPDEPEIAIEATGEVNAVLSDTPQSAIFNLQSAYPNPFNSQTTIKFELSKLTPTRLAVYGVDGRLVEELWRSERPINRAEQVTWNAEGQPGGVYLIWLEAGQDVKTMKAILLR